jgi:hypothetical protein
MNREPSLSWREVVFTGLLVFAIAFAGSVAVAAVWLRDLGAPQLALLGAGNRLSLLVSDGPARLLLATGDDPVEFENALTQVLPQFARRVDVLLVAGADRDLLVPLDARAVVHVRSTAALAPLPRSAEAEALGTVRTITRPQRIQLGPNVSVTVETALPIGADPEEDFPAWRAIIQHGVTRVIVLSGGEAAALFPPQAASVLAIAGEDPIAGWELSPAVALVANSEAIDGPDLRSAFDQSPRQPQWGFRVFPGEALRLRFVPGGIALPSEPAQPLATPLSPPSPAQTRP